MKLRPYQRAAIEALYQFFRDGRGNPLLVLPTASGKSLIQAAFIRGAIESYPSTRVMLVSHVRELLEQNAEQLRGWWPEADIGMYSAGLGLRETDAAVTVAGIQSCYRMAHLFGAISLVIVDECHLIPKRGDGMYLKFLGDLKRINPSLKVIGMSATPYRLGSGVLHEGEGALFNGVAYEASIPELIDAGYLCPLVSKLGASRADLGGVKVRGGEFVSSELHAAVDKDELVAGAVSEILDLCHDRSKWLVFCAGVGHAMHVRDEIRDRGITCECVTGDTSKEERDRIIADFKSGKVRAITNMNVLTTGFNAPDIDAIVLLRPTMSPGLYVQMVGRGGRIHELKKNTLVLDFAGNIMRHGPIDKIRIGQPSEGGGVKTAPMRECPSCQELVFISAIECLHCGLVFERIEKPKHEKKASLAEVLSGGNDDIHTVEVDRVSYAIHQKRGKTPSMRVRYHCGLISYSEWICVEHENFARKKAEEWWALRHWTDCPDNVTDAVGLALKIQAPASIVLDMSGRYPNIIGYRGLGNIQPPLSGFE